MGGYIVLIYDNSQNTLQQWIIVDGKGRKTTVQFANLERDVQLNQKLFMETIKRKDQCSQPQLSLFAIQWAHGMKSAMGFSVATWNINSVRLRIDLVCRFLREHAPDVLCLQETKCPQGQFPGAKLKALGYEHIAEFGQQGLPWRCHRLPHPLHRAGVA